MTTKQIEDVATKFRETLTPEERAEIAVKYIGVFLSERLDTTIGAYPGGAEFIYRSHDLLILWANLGWRYARDTLCDFAITFTAQGKPLPLWLQEYVVWAAKDPPKCRG